jgi:hypothetical protein
MRHKWQWECAFRPARGPGKPLETSHQTSSKVGPIAGATVKCDTRVPAPANSSYTRSIPTSRVTKELRSGNIPGCMSAEVLPVSVGKRSAQGLTGGHTAQCRNSCNGSMHEKAHLMKRRRERKACMQICWVASRRFLGNADRECITASQAIITLAARLGIAFPCLVQGGGWVTIYCQGKQLGGQQALRQRQCMASSPVHPAQHTNSSMRMKSLFLNCKKGCAWLHPFAVCSSKCKFSLHGLKLLLVKGNCSKSCHSNKMQKKMQPLACGLKKVFHVHRILMLEDPTGKQSVLHTHT